MDRFREPAGWPGIGRVPGEVGQLGIGRVPGEVWVTRDQAGVPGGSGFRRLGGWLRGLTVFFGVGAECSLGVARRFFGGRLGGSLGCGDVFEGCGGIFWGGPGKPGRGGGGRELNGIPGGSDEKGRVSSLRSTGAQNRRECILAAVMRGYAGRSLACFPGGACGTMASLLVVRGNRWC